MLAGRSSHARRPKGVFALAPIASLAGRAPIRIAVSSRTCAPSESSSHDRCCPRWENDWHPPVVSSMWWLSRTVRRSSCSSCAWSAAPDLPCRRSGRVTRPSQKNAAVRARRAVPRRSCCPLHAISEGVRCASGQANWQQHRTTRPLRDHLLKMTLMPIASTIASMDGDMRIPVRIGELAADMQLNPKTIRYYEGIGLLPASPRRWRGARFVPRPAPRPQTRGD